MPAIEVDRLVVAFSGVRAVDEVSFQVEPGEVLALLGRNGAGKTTTVEALEGYRSPESGSVRVLGLHPQRQRTELVRRMGVMLQEGGCYPRMGPRRALRLFASYYDFPRDSDELLELLGLDGVASIPARRLSGGERQRLALGLALVGRPEVCFLDEPTSGIDPAGRMVIREVVTELRDAGTAVLLTTHELEEAERIADRLVIIEHGRVAAAGTVAELTQAEGTIGFSSTPGIDIQPLAQVLDAEVIELSPGEYRVSLATTTHAIATLTTWLDERELPLRDLRIDRYDLEEVFLQLTEEPAAASATRLAEPRRRRTRGSR